MVRMRRWAVAGFVLTASVGLATLGLAPAASAQGAAPYAPTYSQLPAFAFGNAMSTCGAPSSTDISSDAPIVAVALTSDNAGCWMTGSDGGVFTHGDAPFYGSMGGKPLNAPVVGMAATAKDQGYWLVAADGGIFSFGDAQFHGSMGGKALNAPIVAMALDPATGGYWEVASDGGVFSFDAPFHGSMARGPQPNPITAIAASPDGGGYLLLPTDPAVELGVPGRSGFDLARQEWVGDGTLFCYQESTPLRQGAQYLLIGESVDGGNTSGYPAAINAFERLDTLPETSNTPTQNAERVGDSHTLNAFFGTNTGGTCA